MLLREVRTLSDGIHPLIDVGVSGVPPGAVHHRAKSGVAAAGGRARTPVSPQTRGRRSEIYLPHAHLGTRGLKGKAHCAVSVVPTLAQRTRKNGAPSVLVVQASED